MNAEPVGECKRCRKRIYCRDGFLDGVVGDDHELYCHECSAEMGIKDEGKTDKQTRE